MGKEFTEEDCPEGIPEWMATFADLVTLLMCFFVLLVSMASFEVTKYKDAVQSLKGALGVMASPNNVLIKRTVQFPKASGKSNQNKRSSTMARKVRHTIREYHLTSSVNVELTKNGFGIKITNPMMFEKGQATLSPALKPFLKKIAILISEMGDTEIRIEGHTDDSPGDNWKISSERAISVVKYLVQAGIDPAMLSAVGLAEFRPLVPNTSSINRAKNRRIQIFVEYLKE